jgi:DNA-binding NtrC family response regulator
LLFGPAPQSNVINTKGNNMQQYANLNSASLEIAGRTDSTVLLTGPTGSGKSRLAQEIHLAGRRSLRPFITVNLASLHEGTLESELFGHERGAFTGAGQRRIGRIELAQGGTLFLDEIGELSPRLQARLLEFMQSRTLTPVGSSRTQRLDVRVIAATHRDLARDVADGRFREDLFHRLRVVTVALPGLDQRPDEFDGILHTCLEEVCEVTGRSIRRLSAGVAEKFENYAWPGNIRELRNVLEYAVQAAKTDEITVSDLPSWFVSGHSQSLHAAELGVGALGNFQLPLTLDFQATLACLEREYLIRALRRCRGRINHTARSIGLSKTTLIRRMHTYGLYAHTDAELEFAEEKS